MVRALRMLAVGAALAMASSASAAPAIGNVTRVEGAATGTVDGVETRLAPRDPVYLGEQIATGGAARLEIVLDDATKLTVGENARMALDGFVYKPAGRSVVRMTVVGAFRFISGGVEAPDAKVTTPFAVIGVRGTDFWGGPIDGRFGVFLFAGAVTVTAGGIEVILNRPGQGVDIDRAAGPPGPVVDWAPAKIGRAAATVTFP